MCDEYISYIHFLKYALVGVLGSTGMIVMIGPIHLDLECSHGMTTLNITHNLLINIFMIFPPQKNYIQSNKRFIIHTHITN